MNSILVNAGRVATIAGITTLTVLEGQYHWAWIPAVISGLGVLATYAVPAVTQTVKAPAIPVPSAKPPFTGE